MYSDEERVLVTVDDNVPVLEVSDSNSTSIGSDFAWLAKVQCRTIMIAYVMMRFHKMKFEIHEYHFKNIQIFNIQIFFCLFCVCVCLFLSVAVFSFLQVFLSDF